MKGKKYRNPIQKPQMVTIPAWEYADLVRDKALLDVVEKLLTGLSEYQARDALVAMLALKGEEDGK